MLTPLFQITEHVIPCQHIREYPHAVKSENAILQLAIKEYRPLNNLDASPGSVTIIGTHANGFPKETYEPLWNDLCQALGFKIRAIWIADSSHQGASGVINENLQGDDPSWFDHSRDLLHMINHFWERMPRPIIGIGHSMGAAQLVQLALIHPRLFYGLALIEPVIQRSSPSKMNPALLTSHRSDLWPSRSNAKASFSKHPFFQAWDPRVLDKYVQYGLRNTPTALYPAKATLGSVTLTTTKHQEAWSYVRSNFVPLPIEPNDPLERMISPDLDPINEGTYQFHRAEPILALQGLPHVRPSILWMFGARSNINTPALQAQKMALSGTGVGGSGGVDAAKVEKAVFNDATHMMPFEKVEMCARVLADWLEKQMSGFTAEEAFYREFASEKSKPGKLAISDKWLNCVRQKADVRRHTKENL